MSQGPKGEAREESEMAGDGFGCVVIGYADAVPSAEDLLEHLVRHPGRVLILTRAEMVESAKEDFRAHARGLTPDVPGRVHRVRVPLSREFSPDSPEMRDSIANLLVGLRYAQGDVVIWFEPPV